MMWVRSFILHFKRIVLFAVVIMAVTGIMNYLYVDDTDAFSRYVVHAFYEEKENIDRLYLGSSHVFCSINPVILDEINGENNLSLATSSQQLNTSYYLLKEAGRKHQIDRVYLDLYYFCMTNDVGRVHSYPAFPDSWKVMYQMKPSLNKLSYMLDLSGPEYYYLTFLPFMQYRAELFHPEYVAKVVSGKQTDVWKRHEYLHVSEGDEHVMRNGEKGFRVYYGVPDAGGFHRTREEVNSYRNPMHLEPESLAYLTKIVEYCKEHEIALTWIVCPSSDYWLMTDGEYDAFVGQMKELADQYEVPYYDFNLCRRSWLDVSQAKYWSDPGHLNTEGAEVFSQFLGAFQNMVESGSFMYEDYFYESYAEKLADLPAEIFGMEIVKSKEYERFMQETLAEQWDAYVIYRILPVTNATAGETEIRVSVRQDTDSKNYEDVPVRWDENDAYVILPIGEHGIMRAEIRTQNSEEMTNWMETEY